MWKKMHCGGVAFLWLCFWLAMPIQTPVMAGPTDSYYQKGKQSYEKGNYLDAAENLFAFLQLAGDGLDSSTRNAVQKALRFSEDQIRVALDTKRQLDATGKVVEVVVETGGKADQGQRTTKRKTFRPPRPPGGSKPRLPKAPKIAKPTAKHAAVKPVVVAPKADKPDVLPPQTTKKCAALEKKVELLIEENEQLAKRSSRMEMRYRRLEQKYKELTNN